MSDSEEDLAFSASVLVTHNCKEGDKECHTNINTEAGADARVDATSHASASKSPHVEGNDQMSSIHANFGRALEACQAQGQKLQPKTWMFAPIL